MNDKSIGHKRQIEIELMNIRNKYDISILDFVNLGDIEKANKLTKSNLRILLNRENKE